MVETGGETEKQSIPLPVRLFLTRLQKLTLAHSLKKDSVIEDCVTKLKAEIAYFASKQCGDSRCKNQT
jgi:hypothetical protein